MTGERAKRASIGDPLHTPAGRMMRSFPVQSIREHWEISDTGRESVIRAALHKNAEKINDFVASCFSLTRQHVRIYRGHGTGFPDTDFAGKSPLVTRYIEGGQERFYLRDLLFTVTLDDPLEPASIMFSWPVRVLDIPPYICLCCTTMEQQISTHFPGRPVLRQYRLLTEGELAIEFIRYRGAAGIPHVDINKGIKSLWSQDLIDAYQAEFKKERSTANEVMDEEFLVKRNSPELFKEMISAPLMETCFAFVSKKELYVDHLRAFPRMGELHFPIHSKNREGIDNVIRSILHWN